MCERVRIVVLVDATGSMGSFCSSVGSTLKQLFAVLDVLFEGTADVDIVSYEDYCDPAKRLLCVCESADKGRDKLKAFAAKLRAGGGGDIPEAVKTALNRIVEMVRARGSSKRTVVIHYTDAPPHHRQKVGSDKDNLVKEIAALRGKEPGFDWVAICRAFRRLGTSVITFMSQSLIRDFSVRFMAMLGDVVAMPDTTPETITKYTMCVLLQLMGQKSESVQRMTFAKPVDVQSLEGEDSEAFLAHLDSNVEQQHHCFEVLPAFGRDLKKLTTCFRESEGFQEVVFRALEELFVPESVLAITYNSVLGLLWRLVCKRREDPRVPPLCDALSHCCTALTGTSQTQLRSWVDQSYNQIEEVREIISAVEDPLAQGALVLDTGAKEEELPTKEEMRSILHAPSPGVLRKVQALLTRLIVVRSGELPVREEDGEHVPMYVPLALADKAVFSLLSHLLLPGMMTSLRPAAMLAILAHLSGNAVLQPRAKAFLESIRGQWIPPVEKAEDYPEVLNGEFVRLVVRAPEFLTESEHALYKHLSLILRVRRAEKLRLPVQTGYTPVLRELTPDFKLPCESCGLQRSRTLMIDGTCAICLSYPPGGSHPEPAEHSSHMAECKACRALYAVVEVDNLKAAPKCHYCRQGTPCESVTCVVCLNRLCAPAPAQGGEQAAEGFTCAVCAADRSRGLQEREVTLAELAEANPGLVRCLGLPEGARQHVFERVGLYKLWTRHSSELQAIEPSRLQSLCFAGKPVLNVAAVFDVIMEQVLHGRLTETCNLCFEERPLGLLQSACGLCANLACQECLGRWYGQLQPGQLYVPSEGLCAFCKRTPKVQTLWTFNRLACRLAGRRSLELRADMYYGWCRSCFRVAEAVPRECAVEAPVLRDFECEACKAKRLLQDEGSLEKLSKACPGCSARTIKISGCNHITCPCGVHWCWQCGWMEREYRDIYNHMQDEHGTIGLDGDNSDFSDEED